MINLVTGEENEITVTVTEKTTIENPYYLFYFRHQQSQVDAAVILENISTHTGRYDTFMYTPELETGTYYYTIYAQESAVNVDPDEADEIVEVGIARVTDTTTEDTQFEDDAEYNTFAG